MKKLLIVSAISLPLLVGCGQKEVIREVLVTTPPTTIATEEPANKYDQYLQALYDNSAQARSWAESDLLELGTLVCQTFDNGGTLDGVLSIFASNSAGKYDDELFSAIIAGSVLYLCPEWASYVQQSLN